MNKLIIHNKSDLPLNEVIKYVNEITKYRNNFEVLVQYEFKDGIIAVVKKNKKSYSIYLYKKEENNEF